MLAHRPNWGPGIKTSKTNPKPSTNMPNFIVLTLNVVEQEARPDFVSMKVEPLYARTLSSSHGKICARFQILHASRSCPGMCSAALVETYSLLYARTYIRIQWVTSPPSHSYPCFRKYSKSNINKINMCS